MHNRKNLMRMMTAWMCVCVGLGGCAAEQALVVKTSSNRRATMSPAGVIRTDGIYACRGLKGIGSAGGLGFWPFATPATQLSFAEFLRFDGSGGVMRWYAHEPASAEDARRFFREQAGGKWTVTGTYRRDASGAVAFVLGGLTANGRSRSSVPYHGEVYNDYLALQIDHGAIFPAEQRYDYREYDFVPDER